MKRSSILANKIPCCPFDLKYMGTNTDMLLPTNCSNLKRLIILDGANLINCGTPEYVHFFLVPHVFGFWNPKGPEFDSKAPKTLTALGMFALMRILIMMDFEVQIYISVKYWTATTHGKEALERLESMGVALRTPRSEYDDFQVFRVAIKTGGIVLSHDRYSDFSNYGNEYSSMVKDFSAWLDFESPVYERMMNNMTTGGHFVSHMVWKFDDHNDKYYSSPGDNYFETTKMHNDKTRKRFEEMKATILETLDEEILKMYDQAKIYEAENQKYWKKHAYWDLPDTMFEDDRKVVHYEFLKDDPLNLCGPGHSN